jgi:hypothetical protein
VYTIDSAEKASGLEAGIKPQAWGRWISPEQLGAFSATVIGSRQERPGPAGGLGGFIAKLGLGFTLSTIGILACLPDPWEFQLRSD